jgi:hypothetical protein
MGCAWPIFSVLCSSELLMRRSLALTRPDDETCEACEACGDGGAGSLLDLERAFQLKRDLEGAVFVATSAREYHKSKPITKRTQANDAQINQTKTKSNLRTILYGVWRSALACVDGFDLVCGEYWAGLHERQRQIQVLRRGVVRHQVSCALAHSSSARRERVTPRGRGRRASCPVLVARVLARAITLLERAHLGARQCNRVRGMARVTRSQQRGETQNKRNDFVNKKKKKKYKGLP